MQVICLQEEAFYELIDNVIEHIENRCALKEQSKWINGEEAMSILRITSKTTLQKLKNNGKIRFSQPLKRSMLYDRNSIFDYIDKHTREVF